MNALLETLLAQRLPTGNRCGVCRHWRSEDGLEGECVQGVSQQALRSGCSANDGCFSWFERRDPQWYDLHGLFCLERDPSLIHPVSAKEVNQ